MLAAICAAWLGKDASVAGIAIRPAQSHLCTTRSMIMMICPIYLFDHPTGADEQGGRRGKGERLSSLEVQEHSILAACCSGSSPGFSPLRTRLV
jgi:hypothetical protein